jgi:hypothetical protein
MSTGLGILVLVGLVAASGRTRRGHLRIAWRISAADRVPDAHEHRRATLARRRPRPLTGSSGRL